MRYFTLHLKERFPFLGENGCDPILTAYLPDNLEALEQQDQLRPCVLLCPGGGYRIVSSREADPIALQLLPTGVNVFILTYSTFPNAFPTQIREAAAAMEVICEHAREWNSDPERIAIMGFSAGGHLAGHYTNCYDCPEVREVFPDSKPVKASILCYAVNSAEPEYRHVGSFEKLSGHPMPLSQEEIEKYSNYRHVSERTPPTFLWHTVQDKTVPVVNSLLYAQALAKHKVPFELHIYPYGRHGLGAVNDQTVKEELSPEVRRAHGWLQNLKDWLANTL